MFRTFFKSKKTKKIWQEREKGIKRDGRLWYNLMHPLCATTKDLRNPPP